MATYKAPDNIGFVNEIPVTINGKTTTTKPSNTVSDTAVREVLSHASVQEDGKYFPEGHCLKAAKYLVSITESSAYDITTASAKIVIVATRDEWANAEEAGYSLTEALLCDDGIKYTKEYLDKENISFYSLAVDNAIGIIFTFTFEDGTFSSTEEAKEEVKNQARVLLDSSQYKMYVCFEKEEYEE